MTTFDKVYDDVLQERKLQDTKWGVQNHTPLEWLSILTEEVGELAKEVNEDHFAASIINAHALRSELIQCAAVCVAFAECLDRKAKL